VLQRLPKLVDAVVGLLRGNFAPLMQSADISHLVRKFLEISVEKDSLRTAMPPVRNMRM